MPKYRILHFATHGYLDSQDGMRSGLVLAHEPGQAEADSLLQAAEIASLPLSAEMAVLSACHTAEGETSGGEGAIGLAWAFRASGVPSIVASQWAVDDSATRQLMVAFYQELRKGRPKDFALQTAMRRVMAVKPQPYYWAAFQLIGDAGPLSLDHTSAASRNSYRSAATGQHHSKIRDLGLYRIHSRRA